MTSITDSSQFQTGVSSPSPIVPSSRGLHAYAVFMAVATFFLVIAGGLVTSTGSALAVPDWPLAFGQFFPRMTGGVLYEHGHRLIAATIGLLTIILAVWLWKGQARPVLRKLGAWAVATVIAQGLLGGITVLFRLPLAISTAHATLGQTFFSLIVCIAVLSNPTEWREPVLVHPMAKKIRALALSTTIFVYIQLVLGAIYRHSGHLLHLHMLNALFVVIHVLLLGRRVLPDAELTLTLRRPVALLLVLTASQLFLGTYAWRLPTVTTTTTHVAVGALILAASIVVTVQAYRKLTPA